MIPFLFFSMCSMVAAFSGAENMAYHVLHPDENMHFLPLILEEAMIYPVETHVFIHTHTHVRMHMPDHFDSKRITIIRHDVDSQVTHEHRMGRDRDRIDPNSKHKTKIELRGDALAVSPTLREHIIRIGAQFDYSMYSEDDMLVTRATVSLWLNRQKYAFERQFQPGFIRLECNLAACKAIDLNGSIVPTGFDKPDFPNERNHVQRSVTNSGVWIYPKDKLRWLDESYPPFLRHNATAGVWSKRDSISIGGAGAFKGTLYAFNDRTPDNWNLYPSLLPEVVVLHSGTAYWHVGVWWCRINPTLPKCLDLPERFYLLSTKKHNDMVISTPVSNANTTRLVDALTPLAIKTCRATDIHFNHSRMHHISSPAMAVSQTYLQIGYGPWITKGGSSSAVDMLTEVTGEKVIATEIFTQALLDSYTFISFIRNPVERALAGYHQMEIFYVMGWLDRTVKLNGIKWWDRNCLDTTYGFPLTRSMNCSGSVPDSSDRTVLRRFVDYLEEIERVGFYDQHQTPISYLMATSSVVVSPRSFYFDIKSMFKVEERLTEMTGKKWNRLVKKSREKPDRKAMPWSLSWKQLVGMQENSDTIAAGLATKAINLVCELYRNDVECLPYTIPECKY
jgi:hypothetical protein